MPRVSTVTLLLHGAGSCAATADALLAPSLAPGSRPVHVDSTGDVETLVARIAETVVEVRMTGGEVVRVAGVSLGAHAAAMWAARTREPVDLVLVMPAWTGPPEEVAAATMTAAAEVEQVGAQAVLDRLRSDASVAEDWVLDELARGWSTYADDGLAAALRAAGSSAAPTLDDLGRVTGRAAVVALADDPLHPEQVARDWARALPNAALRVVARRVPDDDRGALGRAAADALEELSGSR
jgi:pimeloyl-ACP methyl ester carboxylesterase